MKPPAPNNIRAQVVARYAAGASVSALAEEFCYRPNTLYRWLRRAGLSMAASTNTEQWMTYFIEAHKHGKSIGEIARETGWHPNTIRGRLKMALLGKERK